MKHFFLFFILSVLSLFVNAQSGTSVIYVDNFGSVTLNYNGLVNGKHSYQGIDPSGPTYTITTRWTGSQWAIYIKVGSGSDVLSFASPVITASNPPNFGIGMWVDANAGDGTFLLNLTGTGTTSMPLPVELVDFGAINSGKYISLHWITASEVNNSGFDIERSTDGMNWKMIGFVNGSGNAFEMQEYKFLDTKPLTGINYYRLKQVDFDGKYDYSPMVAVKNDIKDYSDYTISPNPFSDYLHIISPNEKPENNPTIIMNSNGVILKEMVDFNGSINTTRFVPGVYFIKLPDGQIKKLVKY